MSSGLAGSRARLRAATRTDTAATARSTRRNPATITRTPSASRVSASIPSNRPTTSPNGTGNNDDADNDDADNDDAGNDDAGNDEAGNDEAVFLVGVVGREAIPTT